MIVYLIYNNDRQSVTSTTERDEVVKYFESQNKELKIHKIENNTFISERYRDNFEENIYCAEYETKSNVYIIYTGEKAGTYPPYDEFSLYVTSSRKQALDIAIGIFDVVHEDDEYHEETDDNDKRISAKKCRKNAISQLKNENGLSMDNDICTREYFFISILKLGIEGKISLSGETYYYFTYNKKKNYYMISKDKDRIYEQNKTKKFENDVEFPYTIKNDITHIEFSENSKNNSFYVLLKGSDITINSSEKEIRRILKREYELTQEEIQTLFRDQEYKDLTLHQLFLEEKLNLSLEEKDLVYCIYNDSKDEIITTKDRKEVYEYFKNSKKELTYSNSFEYVGGYGAEKIYLTKTYTPQNKIYALKWHKDGGGGSYSNTNHINFHDTKKDAIIDAMDYFDNEHNHEDEQDDETLTSKECRNKFKNELKENNFAEMYDCYEDSVYAIIVKVSIPGTSKFRL